MLRVHLLGAALCLPLALGVLVQGSSCGNAKMKENSNSSTSPTPTPSATTGTSQKQVKGQWGGQGVALQISGPEGTLEFDCAHGTINEAIIPNSEGKFEVKGSYVREHPGPIREGEDRKGQQAIYSGSVEGDTLTLQVQLAGSDELMTYTLTEGKSGRIRKCL